MQNNKCRRFFPPRRKPAKLLQPALKLKYRNSKQNTNSLPCGLNSFKHNTPGEQDYKLQYKIQILNNNSEIILEPT